MERLEAQRRLLVAARALSLAQRWLLYAHDELGMATARMRLARPGGERAGCWRSEGLRTQTTANHPSDPNHPNHPGAN